MARAHQVIRFFNIWSCPNTVWKSRTAFPWSCSSRFLCMRATPQSLCLWSQRPASSISTLNHMTQTKHTSKRLYAMKAKSQRRLGEGETEVIDLEGLESSMQGAINSLRHEYTNTIITRLTPAVLDRVSVEVEGESYPLKQVAQIGMPNPSLIVVNLSSYPQAVENAVNALRNSDLNLNPIPEKNVVKVPIPKMSKELREKLVKMAKVQAEKTKVGIRKARQRGIAELKKKEDVSKDSIRKLEKHVQQLTDDYTGKVEEMLKAKTNELMKGS